MPTKTEVKYTGIGFNGMLCLIFITLKLIGYITWSWFWVLFPITFPLALFVSIVAALVLYQYWSGK